MRLHEVNSGSSKPLVSGIKRLKSESLEKFSKRKSVLGLSPKVFLFVCLGACMVMVGYGIFGGIFRVKSVKVEGLEGERQAELTNFTLKELSSRKKMWLFPVNHLVWVGKDDLKFIENDVSVWRLASFRKDWPNTLVLQVLPSIDTFYRKDGSSSLVLGQNGRFLRGGFPDENFSLSSLTEVSWSSDAVALTADGGLPLDLAEDLFSLREALLSSGVLRVVSFKLLPVVSVSSVMPKEGVPEEKSAKEETQQEEVVLEQLEQAPSLAQTYEYKAEPRLSGEVEAVVDLGDDLGRKSLPVALRLDVDRLSLAKNLKLILNRQAKDRLANAVYLDLRFSGRGYLCLSGTPCATNLPWEVKIVN